jgi:hypothetical protein
VPKCQWDGCSRNAQHYVSAGRAADYLVVCYEHRQQWRELSQSEARQLFIGKETVTSFAINGRKSQGIQRA